MLVGYYYSSENTTSHMRQGDSRLTGRHAVRLETGYSTGILSSAHGDLPVDSAALIKTAEKRRERSSADVVSCIHAGLCVPRPRTEERRRNSQFVYKALSQYFFRNGDRQAGRGEDLFTQRHISKDAKESHLPPRSDSSCGPFS